MLSGFLSPHPGRKDEDAERDARNSLRLDSSRGSKGSAWKDSLAATANLREAESGETVKYIEKRYFQAMERSRWLQWTRFALFEYALHRIEQTIEQDFDKTD